MSLPGRSIWHAEIDPDASAVLAARWPAVPNLGSIVGRDWSATPRPDILTAGFPCQPVSAAGRQLADADPRWLWPAVRDAVAALRPPVVFLENVRNITSIHKGRILALILSDLRALGYACRWVIIGACTVGAAHHRHRWFLRGDRVPDGRPAPPAERVAVPACGVPRGHGAVLPTPTARDGDGRGVGGPEYWDERRSRRANGIPLDATVALLPTPRATDGVNGGPNQRGARGDLAMPSAVQPERFGAYAPAVERHVATFRYPPPAPTEPNSNGNARLSPAFVEWLMGLPPGVVIDHVSRNAALRILGNGVVPRQAERAWALLDPQREASS